MAAHTEKNKKAALMCMKRKKMVDKNADELEAMILNIDAQILELEKAMINKVTFGAMKAAQGAMHEIQKDFTPDTVADLMLDFEDLHASAQETQDALTTPIAGSFDDDDTLLEELEQEMANEYMGQVPKPGTMGDILFPSDGPGLLDSFRSPQAEQSEEERELAELHACME